MIIFLQKRDETTKHIYANTKKRCEAIESHLNRNNGDKLDCTEDEFHKGTLRGIVKLMQLH